MSPLPPSSAAPGFQIRSWLFVIVTNVLRGHQRKPDKLEMSKLLYFVHLMLMKNGIKYFFDWFYDFYRSEVIAVLL
jgi:hypothetical protein